jgi:hypothetical protein
LLGKTAYDYANHLLSAKTSEPAAQAETQQEAQPNTEIKVADETYQVNDSAKLEVAKLAASVRGFSGYMGDAVKDLRHQMMIAITGNARWTKSKSGSTVTTDALKQLFDVKTNYDQDIKQAAQDYIDKQSITAPVEATPAAQATTILDEANVTGKERIDALKDVKSGAITTDELQAALERFIGGENTQSPLIAELNQPNTAKNSVALNGVTVPTFKEGDTEKLVAAIRKEADASYAASQKPSKKQNIEDAGEKIGGARKDRWKEGGLNISDLDSMSESEGAELATKANVWKPDYDAIASEKDPVTAAMIKVVYDRLAAQPKSNTPEGRRNFVQMMQAVRKVFGEASSPESVIKASEKLKTDTGFYPNRTESGKALLFSVYKGRSDPFVFDRADLIKAKKMVEEGFPSKGEPWKKRLEVKKPYNQNYFGIYTKERKLVGQAASAEEAQALAKTIYERDFKSKTSNGKEEPKRPHLDKLVREGLDKHVDHDVTADDFIKDFGFRGVEFGNWAAQDERQKIINMAYDGLADLAKIMGVPNKAMSLNGTLGMAFAARGSGKFAAHYESGKIVINMTKIAGGGSMAHEWAHAFDHYFGELDKTDAYTTAARGASGWHTQENYDGKVTKRYSKTVVTESTRLENLRPEIARAFNAVMLAITTGGKPRGSSDYFYNGTKLNGKKSDGYWTRPTEMFARAFESWVFDRVQTMGAKSEYLVHGVDDGAYADAEKYKGDPYPAGDERKLINKAFDSLAAELKTKETDQGVAMFSRGGNDAEFAAEISSELAQYDESFRYPISRSQTLEGNIESAMPDAEYVGDATREDERGESGAESRKMFRTANDEDFYVYELGKKVWIDVSRLDEGSRGSAIYHAVANYAYNTGKTFIGDPAGLSESAIIRRTSAMLSSALRFGGIGHFEASPEQLKGNPEKGIMPLEWRGSSYDKLQSLIESYVGTLENIYPSIRNYSYDFNANKFVDRDGNEVTRERFMAGAEQGAVRASRAGEAGLRKGVFLQSLMASESSQRPALLEKFFRGSGELAKSDSLGRIFSRDATRGGMSVEAAQAIVDKLSDKIDVTVVATPADLPVPAPSDAKGLYHNGKAWIVASNNANAREVAETYAHEVIGHYGLRNMLGDPKFKKTMGLIQLAIKSGNKPLNAIRDQIRKTYVDENGKFNLTPNQEADEIAAAVAQGAIDENGNVKAGFGFMKAVYAKIAQFLRDMGITIKFTNTELQGLLTESLRQLGVGEKMDGGNVTVYSRNSPFNGREVAKTKLSSKQKTISVDGIERPAQNSVGEPIHWSEEGTRNFWRWFGDSKVVDKEGRPKIVYHGAKNAGFSKFETSRHSRVENAYFFTDNLRMARTYSGSLEDVVLKNDEDGESYSDQSRGIYRTYLKIDNPHEMDFGGANWDGSLAPEDAHYEMYDENGDIVGTEYSEDMADAAIENGEAVSYEKVEDIYTSTDQEVADAKRYGSDGAILYSVQDNGGEIDDYEKGDVYVVFNPTQIKSAIGNNGNFAPTNPDIRYSRGEDRAILKVDEHGKNIVFERDGYSIAVNSVDDVSRISLWENGKNVGNLNLVAGRSSDLKGYKAISSIEINKANRGIGLATEMYRVALKYIGEKYKGIGGENEQRSNSKQIPAIYKRLGGIQHQSGDFTIDKSGNDLLTPYTESEARAKQEREEQAIKDEQRTVSKPEKKVTADQVDLFNPQGGLFSRGGNVWSTPEQNTFLGRDIDKFIYESQDSRVDLKRVQEAITKSGQQIEEKYDARLAETLYMGRVAYRSQHFLDTEAKTLLKAMESNKVEMTELSDFLHARGAEERNKQITKVNPDMPDGGAGKNSQGTLMTTQAAKDYLANIRPGRRVALGLLAKQVDAITAGTRQLLVSEGLEKKSTIDAWEAAYKNYIPMFRDEAQSGTPHPQGLGFNVSGSASKRAMGSEKEVTNILAHVLMQREAAITRAEKNRVGLSLYGMALSHPNKDFWTTIKPNMSKTAIANELEAMGIKDAEFDNAPTLRLIDKVTRLVRDMPNPHYKQMPGAITLKLNGEDRVLMLNVSNERGDRLAQSLKNLDGLTKLDLANSIIGKTTRWMAAVNTQYNPIFGFVNVVRDVWGAAVNLGSTELNGSAAKVLFDTPAALKGIAANLMGKKGGKWLELYDQFQADGGQTGYKEMFRDASERNEAIEKQLKDLQREGGLTAGRAAHAVLDALAGFNTTLENGVRLSAYSAALDKGMSRPAAAKLARELTVDFNRKGRLGREWGPLYAFLNASIQGTSRTMETLRGKTGAQVIVGGLMLGAAQALMLAAAGFDDDEIDEYVKTRSLIIPTGDKKYISIPYPLGLHVLPNTGRVIAELVNSKGKNASGKSASAVGELAGAFSPFGGGNIFTLDGALRTILPTVMDPLVELGVNKNFAGRPIEKESYGDEKDGRPGYQKAKESTQRSTTGQAYLGISKLINDVTMGSDYEAGVLSPTPERLRYIAQTAGGGVLRELEKIINLSTKDDAVKSTELPLVGRFTGQVDDDRVQQSRYFKTAKEIDRAQMAIRIAKQKGDGAAMEKIIDRHPEIMFAQAQDRVQRDLSKLNKIAVQVLNNPDEIKDIDKARIETMRGLNESIRELERSSK